MGPNEERERERVLNRRFLERLCKKRRKGGLRWLSGETKLGDQIRPSCQNKKHTRLGRHCCSIPQEGYLWHAAIEVGLTVISREDLGRFEMVDWAPNDEQMSPEPTKSRANHPPQHFLVYCRYPTGPSMACFRIALRPPKKWHGSPKWTCRSGQHPIPSEFDFRFLG